MKTYVINLEKALSRRAFMDAQLGSSGLDYEFVAGVDGYRMSPEARAGLVDEVAVSTFPSWLTPGSIGCTLSHRKVYELVRDARCGPALVLEDDAVLPPDLATLAEAIASVLPSDGVVLLDFRSAKPCRLSKSGSIRLQGCELLFPADPDQPISSLAYVVGERAAANMAEAAIPVRWAADSWGKYVQAGAVGSLRCALPRPVKPSPSVRSMTRHDDIQGFRDRMLETWPVQLLRRVNRRRIAWLMYRIELVD